jgi:hypothetical protein
MVAQLPENLSEQPRWTHGVGPACGCNKVSEITT